MSDFNGDETNKKTNLEFRIFELKIGGLKKCHFFKSTNFSNPPIFPFFCIVACANF
jgi:hypothetical protein